MINTSHQRSIGRSSAIIRVGTFLGFGFGPPLTGYLVNRTGSYGLSWIVVIIFFLVVGVMAMRLRHYLALQTHEEFTKEER